MKLLISLTCFSIAILLTLCMDGCKSSSISEYTVAGWTGKIYDSSSFKSPEVYDSNLSYIEPFDIYCIKIRIGIHPTTGKRSGIGFNDHPVSKYDLFSGTDWRTWGSYKLDRPDLIWFFGETTPPYLKNLPYLADTGKYALDIQGYGNDEIGEYVVIDIRSFE